MPFCLTNHRARFDSIVQAPYLRQPALELYQAKVDYLKDPTLVSHAMLYGDNADEAAARQNMPFMTPIYDLLKKHKGQSGVYRLLGSDLSSLSGRDGTFEYELFRLN